MSRNAHLSEDQEHELVKSIRKAFKNTKKCIVNIHYSEHGSSSVSGIHHDELTGDISPIMNSSDQFTSVESLEFSGINRPQIDEAKITANHLLTAESIDSHRDFEMDQITL